MTNIAIEMKNLTRDYGKGRGAFDINLSIPKGTVFGLLGRNGAGKTTLLQMLVGLAMPNHGQATIMGMDCSQEYQKILAITGYMDEKRAMYDWMTIQEILDFTASFYTNWDKSYTDEMLKEYRLDPTIKIKHLSKGQRAEVAMILALGHHPEVLILDEPTSGLDVIVRHEFLEKFIHFACRQGTTILLSSHILEDMERVCDQIGFMDEGRMIFEDSMENIRANFSRQFPERKSGLKEIFISVIHDGFRNEEGKV